MNLLPWPSGCTKNDLIFQLISSASELVSSELYERPKYLLTLPGSADYGAMSASKLESILNNLRTTLSDVDIRQETEWDLPTLDHAKARLQWLAADALQAMNLIDELVEQHAED